MKRNVLLLLMSLVFCCGVISAEEVEKSELHKRAESIDPAENIAAARSLFIRAFEDYSKRGFIRQGVECGVRATPLYYKESMFKEAFDLLHRIEAPVVASSLSTAEKSSLYYLTSKERFQMYMKMRRPESAKEQLNIMTNHANLSNEDNVKNDLLYNKAIYYYMFGYTAQGNAVFKEMADKLTASKDYDKVDEVYKTLIASGRKSGSVSMVAQSYDNYILWKDSTNAVKRADEIGALNKQITDLKNTITEKDSTLSTRMIIITGLCILAGVLAVALVLGALVLMRFILQNRKLKKNLRLSDENNALKAKFISNISAQLDPTLEKLDSRQPEVKALQDFSSHIQTLSELENSTGEDIELEETQLPKFCEGLMDQIRDKVKANVTLKVNAPAMSANINRDYVSHILLHLLKNAAIYTPEGGSIWLDYKKRGAHVHQFLVSDTGCGIPEEQRDNLFKAFVEIKDLTTGDGLGLPICKQMALKMKGDLDLDPSFTKGTRFVLDLHS